MDTSTDRISGSEKTIPYFCHEGDMARMERTVKRLWAALLLALVLIFASNAAWLWAWMQYDYVEENSSVDIEAKYGVANYVGHDGTITNGKDSSEKDGTEGNAAQW